MIIIDGFGENLTRANYNVQGQTYCSCSFHAPASCAFSGTNCTFNGGGQCSFSAMPPSACGS